MFAVGFDLLVPSCYMPVSCNCRLTDLHLQSQKRFMARRLTFPRLLPLATSRRTYIPDGRFPSERRRVYISSHSLYLLLRLYKRVPGTGWDLYVLCSVANLCRCYFAFWLPFSPFTVHVDVTFLVRTGSGSHWYISFLRIPVCLLCLCTLASAVPCH